MALSRYLGFKPTGRAGANSALARYLVAATATAAGYYATGRLGLALAVPPGYATAIWPPSGIALAAILIGGYRLWPAVSLGSFLVNVGTGFVATTNAELARSLIIPATIAAGAALQAVVGAFLVRRFVGFPDDFATPRKVGLLLLFGGAAACLINASLSVGVLYAGGRIPAANLPFSWATWWAGDTMGVAVFSSLVIAWVLRREPVWAGRWRPLTLGLGASFAVAVALASLAASRERANLVATFDERSISVRTDLQSVIKSYFTAVDAVQARFREVSAPSRSGFASFASAIRAQVPAIQALEWIPKVDAPDRDQFERHARADGAQDFEITEKSDGKLVRAGARPEYLPVGYVDPVRGNEAALGFDLASNPARLAALRAAGDSGTSTVSAPIELVQGQEGFLVLVALYRGPTVPTALDQRRASLRGFALGVFRFSTLAGAAFPPQSLAKLDYWLLDATDAGAVQILSTNSTAPPATFHLGFPGLLGSNVAIGEQAVFDVGGRRWVLRTAPTQAFLAHYRPQTSWGALFAGLAITALVGAFILVVTGRERVLRLLFMGNPEAMWAYDQKTLQFVEVNDTAVARYGYSRDEFRSMRITDIRPPQDVPRLLEVTAVPAQGYRSAGEWRHRLKDGRIIDVEIRSHGVNLGNRLVTLVAAHDITERKRAEAALIENERGARAIMDTALDAFVQIDEDGRITIWNSEAEALFGWSRQEAVGAKLADLIIPPEQREAHRAGLARFLNSGEPVLLGRRCAFEAQRRDGKTITVELAITAITRHGRYLFNGFIRDVTQKLVLEAQVAQAQKMEALGGLTGGMAHDFNNILGVIIGNLDLLRDLPADAPDRAELLTDAFDAAQSGADLTRHLLAFARRQRLSPQVADANQLLLATTTLLRRTLGENIEVDLRLGGDIWPIRVDRSQLEATITNLSTNARDAMPNGGKLIFRTANAQLDEAYAAHHAEVQAGEYVLIEVCDTGVGMPADVQAHVFEPFFTTKEPGKGTGLGLSMVFGFMKQSGGHINVYSEVGQGTCIRLYLPRHSEPGAAPEVSRRSTEAIPTGSETVLVVEDNARLRRAVTRQLHDLGYEVVEAENAASALEILRGRDIDLLFTDIVMPGGMSGFDLARSASALRPAIKILFTSGFPETRIEATDEVVGIKLLSKPYRKDVLARTLRDVLDR